MRSLIVALSLLGAAALTPSFASAQAVDVTVANCGAVAASLAANPETWPEVHRQVMWSHGYTVGTEKRSPGFNYDAVDAFMKALSAGICHDPAASLFASVKPLTERKVSEDDAYDLTDVSCEEWFKENRDETNGRLDEADLVGDLAWLDGFVAAQNKAAPSADFAAIVTATRAVLGKCKTGPRLNVATLFELFGPARPAAAPAPALVPAPAVAPALEPTTKNPG